MLTVYIIFLCFSAIIALLNVLNVFHVHFADTNADLDMDTDISIETDASIDALDLHQEDNRFISTIIFILRFSFYFSIGFGAVGVISTLLNQPSLIIFVVAVITGILAYIIAKYITRLFVSTIGTAIDDKKLIGLEGKVILPIYKDQIGQVSINYSDHIYTRYAKLTKQAQNIDVEKNTLVKVLSINLNNELIVDVI